MSNLTAAEKERIRKKHKTTQIISWTVGILFLAAFIIVCERRSTRAFNRNPEANVTPAPTVVDARIEYVQRFSTTGYSLDDKAVRLDVSSGCRSAQLIISGSSADSLTIVYRAELERVDDQPLPTSLFPNVDRPTETPALNTEELDLFCETAVHYFDPLFSDTDSARLKDKLRESALPVFKSDTNKAEFIFGVYCFVVDYSDPGGIMSVTASPSN